MINRPPGRSFDAGGQQEFRGAQVQYRRPCLALQLPLSQRVLAGASPAAWPQSAPGRRSRPRPAGLAKTGTVEVVGGRRPASTQVPAARAARASGPGDVSLRIEHPQTEPPASAPGRVGIRALRVAGGTWPIRSTVATRVLPFAIAAGRDPPPRARARGGQGNGGWASVSCPRRRSASVTSEQAGRRARDESPAGAGHTASWAVDRTPRAGPGPRNVRDLERRFGAAQPGLLECSTGNRARPWTGPRCSIEVARLGPGAGQCLKAGHAELATGSSPGTGRGQASPPARVAVDGAGLGSARLCRARDGPSVLDRPVRTCFSSEMSTGRSSQDRGRAPRWACR